MTLKKIPRLFIILLIALCGFICSAQKKYEREYRIRKSQFPTKALSLIEDKIAEAKRVKFYKETDSTKVSFEAKLKKDRLWYSIEFDKNGVLEDIEILIRPADVPNDTYAKIEEYLQGNFTKHRIKRLQQQYPAKNEASKTTINNAFQNLILPSNNYELIVAGKKEKGYMDYEILFDAEGNFKKIRTSVPPNYHHVLY